MSTERVPPWLSQVITAAASVVATWLALGQKMEAVVDGRIEAVEERVKAYVDDHLTTSMAMLDDSINAKVLRATEGIRTEVRNVGTSIAGAVTESDRPVYLAPDTTGNASRLAELQNMSDQMAAIMRELQRQAAPPEYVPSTNGRDRRRK